MSLVRVILACALGTASLPALGDAVAVDDWRRQVIYFPVLDRFVNGDPSNDATHGASACNDRGNPHAFQGGDLVGLASKLDYVAALGATTIWLSPLYKGVPEMEGVNCGFPGYWADFAVPYRLEIDPRFGREADFDALIRLAKDRRMKVILDMVVNHAGYGAEVTRQRPDWFTDPTTCAAAGSPEIYCPLAGLPDFDHRRRDVREYLVSAHLSWLQRFAFDGIRMDTVKHVEAGYFRDDWIPAMRRARPQLYVVGELLDEGSFEPFDRYLQAGFDGLFNFPLRSALVSTFAQGNSVDVTAARMQETLERFGEERAAFMVNLLDNHDVPRFVQAIPLGTDGADATGRYLLAMTALLTMPGIPQIYYGNEVGMDGGGDPHNRRFMPAWAFDAAGRAGSHAGHLERPDLIHDHVQKLLAVRKQHAALQIGHYRELWRQNGAHNANVWAFLRHAAEGDDRVVVAFNNGTRPPDGPLPVSVADQLRDGVVLDDVLGQAGIAPVSVRDGRIELDLPGRTAVILVPRR